MGKKRKEHDRMIDDLLHLVRNDYENVRKKVNVDGQCEIDLLGIIDDDFVDIYEVKSYDSKYCKRNAYWQLHRNVHHIDGKKFVNDLYLYTPVGLYLLKGEYFILLQT